MKQVTRSMTVGFLVLVCVGFPVFGRSVNRHREPKILCIDHERYVINEWEIAPAAAPPAANSDLIIVDKKRVRLTLYRDGKELKRFTVAIGKPSTPSPVGEWKIINKGGTWGGGFGARWMGLNVPWGIYGIHGTNKPNSIGWMSSHGCIRMHNQSVIELYNLVQVGTPVHIVGELEDVKLRKQYHKGMSGQDVTRVQLAIRQKGIEPGPADGRFGVGMEQAALKLQMVYGLAQTGKLTLNELYLLGLR